MTDSEREALELLRRMGLKAERLPESGEDDVPMPDILAEDGAGLRYLIEVKEKVPHEPEEENRRATLNAGEVYSRSVPIERRNVLSGVSRDAVVQLTSPGAPEADLRLIWFRAAGRLPDVQLDQLFDTLYGAVTLFDLEREVSRRCLYYTFSDFFRFAADLDGAIGYDGEHVCLWLNSLSPGAERLAASELAARFEGGVFDPRVEEEAGHFYIADTPLDRREPGPVLLYVQRKYDRWHKLTPLMRVAHTAEVAIPVSEAGEEPPNAPTSVPPDEQGQQ